MNIRYIHIRTIDENRPGLHRYGGATVRLEQKETDKFAVFMSVAICHKRDNFNKRTGRVVSSGYPAQRIPLRYLGGVLDKIAEEVEESTGLFTKYYNYHQEVGNWLPKE